MVLFHNGVHDAASVSADHANHPPRTAACARRSSCGGSFLASGSLDETIRIYAGDTLMRYAIIGHFPDWVRCLDWHPHQPILACGCKDGRIWLWNTDTNMCIGTLEAHTASVVALAWSPDGTRLASGSEDTTACVWRLQAE